MTAGIRNTTPLELEKAMARHFLKDPVAMSVNAYLINTGTKLVLVDAGGGSKFYGRVLGRLSDNLRAAGYQPDQVDEVYITHMHSDHVGGLMAGDKLAFSNAIVRADQREAGYWLGEVNMDAAAHTVTADEGSAFDVQVNGGGTATFTAPTKPGSYAYHCTYHPGMHGTLVVK